MKMQTMLCWNELWQETKLDLTITRRNAANKRRESKDLSVLKRERVLFFLDDINKTFRTKMSNDSTQGSE